MATLACCPLGRLRLRLVGVFGCTEATASEVPGAGGATVTGTGVGPPGTAVGGRAITAAGRVGVGGVGSWPPRWARYWSAKRLLRST